ncbi:hypothetical protein DV736_g4877, partial [Chaetothyriales sp. CBS 134916]
MANPRIEEVSDSDPEIDDPSAFLPADSLHALQPAAQPVTPSSSASQQPNPTLFRLHPTSAATTTTFSPPIQQSSTSIKHYITLYPIYFSSAHTRAQGRRVSAKYAVPNPLAYNLVAAVRHVLAPHHLPITLEPNKAHPRDWSNPGRVRIQLFSPSAAATDDDDHANDDHGHHPLHPTIKSKSALYNLIGKYLQSHPTEPLDPLQLKLQGLRAPENFAKEPVPVPRGWRMNTILPVHSAAVSGGGVSDNFFKDAVEEMKQAQAQGMLPPGMGGAGAGGPGGGGMPDMSQLQAMMQSMGGLGGGGGGGGGGKKGRKK